MCISRDGDQASTLTPAESCRDRSPLRARLCDGAMWSLKSQPGLVYICLLKNREQMRSNTLLLCGDAALGGCSGICCGFLPLIYPSQFIFSSFLFLAVAVAFIFNFHDCMESCRLIIHKSVSLPPSSKLIIHLFCARWSLHNRSTEDLTSTKD